MKIFFKGKIWAKKIHVSIKLFFVKGYMGIDMTAISIFVPCIFSWVYGFHSSSRTGDLGNTLLGKLMFEIGTMNDPW